MVQTRTTFMRGGLEKDVLKGGVDKLTTIEITTRDTLKMDSSMVKELTGMKSWVKGRGVGKQEN